MATKIGSKSWIKSITKNWQLYVMIALPLIWLFTFRYGPMYGIQLAFKKYFATMGIFGSPWVGLDNFTKFFESPKFAQVVGNTLTLSIYGLVAGFPIPIILALALNTTRNAVFKKTVQFVSYMPYFISTVVLVGMLILFTNSRIGIFNILLGYLNIGPINFMGEPTMFRSMYVWSGIWQHMGYNSVIYIAALASIDPEQHEAAVIDGASRFRRVLHIDLPGILPTIITLLILNSGYIMSVGFEKVYLMQNPLSLNTSEIISTYVYKVSLAASMPDFAYSTAIGLFNSVINLIILVIVNQIAKKTTETNLF